MSARADILIQRDRLLQAIRRYFRKHGFIEVETPVMISAPALEDYIDAIPAADGRWLRTSPELQMKKMLAGGLPRIFQVGPCFRAGEHGRRHREEFTMLEWYQAEADYLDLLSFTDGLLRVAAAAVGRPSPAEALVLSLTVAAERFLGLDAAMFASAEIEEVLVRLERCVPPEQPVFLLDFPASQAALARLKPDDPAYAERWELFWGGLELANAYSELTGSREQRRRFEATARLRAADGREVYPVDEEFLAALDSLPPCAGCALGIDRLLMALLKVDDIGEVRGEQTV